MFAGNSRENFRTKSAKASHKGVRAAKRSRGWLARASRAAELLRVADADQPSGARWKCSRLASNIRSSRPTVDEQGGRLAARVRAARSSSRCRHGAVALCHHRELHARCSMA